MDKAGYPSCHPIKIIKALNNHTCQRRIIQLENIAESIGQTQTWVGNDQKDSVWTVLYEVWNNVYKQNK